MQISFTIESANYELADDTLTAVVFRSDHTERYQIVADFDSRKQSIVDLGNFEGDYEMQYPSQILCAFMTLFSEEFGKQSHTHGPGEVMLTLIESSFDVNAI